MKLHASLRAAGPPAEERGSLGRFVGVLLLLVVLLLVTVFFAVRTRGGHAFVEERIERLVGLPLTIERMRIGWPYALVLEQVRSEALSGDRPVCEAQEVRVRLGWKTRWHVTVRRAAVRLSRNRDGVWEPAFFSRLGDLVAGDPAAVSALAARFGGHVALDIVGGTVEWEQGGAAYDVTYRLTPVRIPGRRLDHHVLQVYSLVQPDGRRLHDLDAEWLSSATIPCLELKAWPAGQAVEVAP